MLRRDSDHQWNRGDFHDHNLDNCSLCKKYHKTVKSFTENFKLRNKIFKPLEPLKEQDAELINYANKEFFKWRNILYYSPDLSRKKFCGKSPDNKVTLLHNSNLVIPKSSSSDLQQVPFFGKLKAAGDDRNAKKIVVTETETGDTDVALSEDNREDSAGLERRENIANMERAEKFSKLERRLQELSLGLQNLHDDLESVQLNSNMYYSNVIEYLDDTSSINLFCQKYFL